MIKKEYKHFFTRKYILFLLPVFVFVLISGTFSFKNLGNAQESVYSDFSDYVEFYENREQLQEQYEYYSNYYTNDPILGPILTTGNKYEEISKRVAILKFCLDNDLQYDQIIDGAKVFANGKYTVFNYLYSFTTAYVVFAIVSCMLLGCCYQPADMLTKTSILVYTTGEKRNKIIDRKFLVSLSALLGFTVLYYIAVALCGLSVAKTSPEYLIYFVGDKMFSINYFEFFMMVLFSQLFMLLFTYAFIYYFAVAVKNTIAGLCIMFLIFAISVFTAGIKNRDIKYLLSFLQGGYLMLFDFEDYLIKYCFYFIPLAVAVICMVVISKVLSKKADYSR